MTSAPRRLSLRGSVGMFLLMSAAVIALSMAMLVFLDPRTHEYWGTRLGELGAWFRALVGR